MIRFEGVSHRYGGLEALRGVSFEVPAGALCVLLGESGSGKSTLLRTVNRLIEPRAGRVLLDGRDVADIDPEVLRRGIGYVIQSVGLFPHRSVAANVATVPRLLGWDRARIEARVDALLSMVGLDPAIYRDRRPATLSGGQAQRVGLARALAADPPVLLDGRTLLGPRSGHAAGASSCAPANPCGDGQDDPARHPRPPGSSRPGRPYRGDGRGRAGCRGAARGGARPRCAAGGTADGTDRSTGPTPPCRLARGWRGREWFGAGIAQPTGRTPTLEDALLFMLAHGRGSVALEGAQPRRLTMDAILRVAAS